jgi:hypothetical protein
MAYRAKHIKRFHRKEENISTLLPPWIDNGASTGTTLMAREMRMSLVNPAREIRLQKVIIAYLICVP